MKTLYIISLFVLGAVPISAQEFQNYSARELSQKVVTLDKYAGEKLTIIDFWATWCKPCLESMPELQIIYEDFKDEGVALIGVSVDSPRNLSKIKPLASSLGVEYPILSDPNSDLMNRLKVSAMPTLIIFDSNGKELYRHVGFQKGDELDIIDEIEAALD